MTTSLNSTMIDFSSYGNQEGHHQNDNVGLFNFLPQQKTKTDQVSPHSMDNGNNYYLFADSSTPNRIPCNYVDSGYFEQDSFSDPLSPPLAWAPSGKLSQFDSVVSEIVDEDKNCSLFSFDGSLINDSSPREKHTDSYADNDRSVGLQVTNISTAGQPSSVQSHYSYDRCVQTGTRNDCWPDGGRSAHGKAEIFPHKLDIKSSSLQSNLSFPSQSVPNANYLGIGGNVIPQSLQPSSRYSHRQTSIQERHPWSSTNSQLPQKEETTADPEPGIHLNMCKPTDFSKEFNANGSPFTGNDRCLLDFNGNNPYTRSNGYSLHSSRTSSVKNGEAMKGSSDNANLTNQNSHTSLDLDPHGISGSFWNQAGGSFPNYSEHTRQTNNNDISSEASAWHHNINAINYLTQNALNRNNQVEHGTIDSPSLAGLYPSNNMVGDGSAIRNQSIRKNRTTDNNHLSPKSLVSKYLSNQRPGSNHFMQHDHDCKYSHQQLTTHSKLMANKSVRNCHISEKGDAGDVQCSGSMSTRISPNQSAAATNSLPVNNPSVDNSGSVGAGSSNQLSSRNNTLGNNPTHLSNSQVNVSPEELLQCLSKLQTSVASSIIQQHHFASPNQSTANKGSTTVAQDRQQRTKEDTRHHKSVPIYTNPTTGVVKGIPTVLQHNDRHQHVHKGSQELYHPSLAHPNPHHQHYLPSPGLVSGHFLTGHPPYPTELVEFYPMDPYPSFTPAFIPPETIYDVPAYYGLPPFIQGFKQPRRSGPSIELHLKLEECYEQFRNTERERKKTEAELARQHPGKRISSANNIVVPRLPSNPSHVDRLVVDSFKEHARILTLIDKMERLMGTGLHPNIHSALERWLEGIRKVQARRKEDIVNETNRNRNGVPRHQDDKDVLALAASISELTTLARRARTATWCALQISDKDNPTLCKLGIDMRMPSLPLHFQQTFMTKLPTTDVSTSTTAKD